MILDWKEYTELAIQAAADGAVLLKNDNRVLPIAKDVPIALFGRVQNFYFKSGTGSGGMVNVSKVWTVRDALKEEGFKLDEELEKTYQAYDEANPYKRGKGFGQEPWSQEEMPLAKEVAEAARKNTDTAVVLIGRTAGEEQDNTASEGSYYLAAEEVRMLRTVRETFPKMVLLLNVSSVIDMKEILDIAPDAVMYIWQGGMVGETQVPHLALLRDEVKGDRRGGVGRGHGHAGHAHHGFRLQAAAGGPGARIGPTS